MAGMIDLTGKDPWSSIGGAAGGSDVGVLAGLATANPLSLMASGLSILSGMKTTKIEGSKAQTDGMAQSGLAEFGGSSAIKLNKPLIDLSEPLNVVIYGVVLVGVIYAVRKVF